MTALLAQNIAKPAIGWFGLSPLIALFGGAIVVLMLGLSRSRSVRQRLLPAVTIIAFAAAGLLGAFAAGDSQELFVAAGAQGALKFDGLALAALALVATTGIVTVLLSWRSAAPREAAHGEYYTLLLISAAGMVVFAAAQNLITFFLGLELLSIPLYVLCATELRRAGSIEAALKYLIIGALGSATLLYGLAMLYGASGNTDFRRVAAGVAAGSHDSLVLVGAGLVIVGLAFKGSIAPFHQWTPDVYQGSPTPVTAFMAVATKVATMIAALRLLAEVLVVAQPTWAPILAALATTTIVVGNVGALRQDSLKRMLAWSSIAQAGYLLAGIIVSSRLGAQALLFYLSAYLLMNLAAFAVVIARERETTLGDSIEALRGIGRSRPLLAWPMVLAMLGLAGIPVTVGFVGKVALIAAAADGGYAWLGVVIVLGSVISLGYYLRVVVTLFSAPTSDSAQADSTLAAEAEARVGSGEVVVVAALAGLATLVFGVLPSPLLSLAERAAASLGLL